MKPGDNLFNDMTDIKRVAQEIEKGANILNDLNKFIQNYLQNNYKFIGNFHKDFEKIVANLVIVSIYENINEKEEYRQIKKHYKMLAGYEASDAGLKAYYKDFNLRKHWFRNEIS